ncbi:MAG TPA: glycogen/starch/alpha-glucan phosphorylase [Candidatus Saccharimonadia bacterium]|nr:glycogen/starch/alpha-glucan phosphorylase [Candidatus Saccharimonadia bacterium]
MWRTTPSTENEPLDLTAYNDAEAMKASIRNHLLFTLAHDPQTATKMHWWWATCMAVRDRALAQSFKTMRTHRSKNVRRVHYLSLEYLMGRLLENNLRNTALYDSAKEALTDLGQDLEAIINREPDMGLGNGGLGRLAACFLDSLSTLDLPAVGYGIHYEFGLFRQEFLHGRQVEQPDAWTREGSPWKITRPEYKVEVSLYGHVTQHFDDYGNGKVVWENTRKIIGLPWDIPIIGFRSATVNFLRLWESRATDDFNLKVFNEGSYIEAIHDKAASETVSKVLYPNDATESGKELRLVQQYFFVACSLSDIMRRYKRDNQGWEAFADKIAIQLNDTHPAVAIPELMRLLLDVEELPWEQAWSITQRTFSYTNHTLLPEALETWSVGLFEKVLPRHLQIIYTINERFLRDEVARRWPGDVSKLQALSIIDESGGKRVRMAHLSVLGSHHTNGVAALHTRLLRAKLFPEFNELFPGRFLNMTNGITPRRWLMVCNPELTSLITETIGDGWTKDAMKLRELEPFAEDPVFQQRFRAIKRKHKEHLTTVIKKLTGYEVSADAIFDVQIKRLHEYKRQHLNLLHILVLYRRLLQDPGYDMQPRVFIFAAKAAPGYYLAKNIIHAINAVAEKVNNDPRILGKLKVAYLPNYGVTLAERIIPAADVSEQISTAGKEASGTGNMKLALNGALTIGTLDGANVEIMEEVGDDNIFIFGMTVEEVEALHARGYNPWDYYWNDAELRNVIDWIASDFFTGNADDFKPLRSSLLDGGDPFMVCADFRAYVDAQEKVDAAYRDTTHWTKMSILNTARTGFFSSDRTIAEYAEKIWKLPGIRVE